MFRGDVRVARPSPLDQPLLPRTGYRYISHLHARFVITDLNVRLLQLQRGSWIGS